MGFQSLVPPHKNVLPPAPPTRIQVCLNTIRRLFLSTSPPGKETFGMQKLAVLFALILFLIQVGLAMFGVQQNFAFGVICWLAIIGLCIYVVWVWERTGGLPLILKLLSSIVVAALILVLIWSPAKTQYHREHPRNLITAPPKYMPTTEIKPSEVKPEPQKSPVGMKPQSAKGPPPAKRPTFKETLGDFVAFVGGHQYSVSRLSTKQKPTIIISFGNSPAITAYVEADKLYVDALLYYAPDKPPLHLVHNELKGRPPQWDRNFDDSAIEIVDDKLTPRFQMIYMDTRTVVVHGVFQFPDGAAVFGSERADYYTGSREKGINIPRIFEYPSRLYQGKELSDVQRSEPPKPEPQNPPSQMPNVALRFVYPKSPALVIMNTSDSVARDIKWSVVLWNMDLPDRNNPLPIPTSTFDWVKAHDEGGPQNLFDTPLVTPLLKPRNRLFGCASVDCPGCSTGRTYIVYIVWGQGGWFSETNIEKPGKLIIPRKVSRESIEEYFKSLEALAPESARIPIGDLP